MITELALLSPFISLSYFGIISWYYVPCIILFIYWIPKWFFIRGIEYFFPQIATRFNSTFDVALTFDDVPYGSYKKIIELLNKYEMKGTFFIISGDMTLDDEETLVEAVRRGHLIANHGKTNSMHAIKSMSELKKEILHCHRLILRIYEKAEVPIPTLFYRPGCGLYHNKMLKYVERAGYVLALGSVYPNDPVVIVPSINDWYIRSHLEGGDVVILHDRNWTPKLLEQLLPWMKSMGHHSITLDDAFRTA